MSKITASDRALGSCSPHLGFNSSCYWFHCCFRFALNLPHWLLDAPASGYRSRCVSLNPMWLNIYVSFLVLWLRFMCIYVRFPFRVFPGVHAPHFPAVCFQPVCIAMISTFLHDTQDETNIKRCFLIYFFWDLQKNKTKMKEKKNLTNKNKRSIEYQSKLHSKCQTVQKAWSTNDS